MEDKNTFKLAMGEISFLKVLKTVMESYQISFKGSSGCCAKCVFHNDKSPA